MSEAEPIIFIVDDDVQVRNSLVNLLRSVDLKAEAYGSTDALVRRGLPSGPSCLILDVRFPASSPSGLDFQRQLIEADIRLPIIFITGHADVPMSVQAMKSGAIEFLTKPVREQDLLDAIRKGIDRDRQRRDAQRVLASLRKRFDSLTVREREIMALVAQGLLNKQIAAELRLSEVTVKVHRGQIMRKMEARSLVELARMSDTLSASSVEQPDTKV